MLVLLLPKNIGTSLSERLCFKSIPLFLFIFDCTLQKQTITKCQWKVAALEQMLIDLVAL